MKYFKASFLTKLVLFLVLIGVAQAQQTNTNSETPKKIPQLTDDDFEAPKVAPLPAPTSPEPAKPATKKSLSSAGLSMDSQEGSVYYLKRDFKRAIVYYQKALALEKENPQLEKTIWRVLVDNLGMAYGVSGDLKNAQKPFEYGLSKDPTYPMFHYNQACTYAEMGDLEQAVQYLKKAYEYREGMIPGERLPNPRNDSSFRKFLSEERFVKVLSELGV